MHVGQASGLSVDACSAGVSKSPSMTQASRPDKLNPHTKALPHGRVPTPDHNTPRLTLSSAFTLTELLVVMAIISVLASLLLAAVSSAKSSGRRAVCISNLRQIGLAVHSYANDNSGRIPYGPIAPPFTSPASFYPSTGSPTSLISLQGGSAVGLGLLLRDQLAQSPKVLFCPGADQPLNADVELKRVGTTQAQGSYYYRHAGVTELFQTPPEPVPHLLLENLGLNHLGQPIHTLALDTQFLCPPGLESFNIRTRTHHQALKVNVLHADGHVVTRPNLNRQLTVDVQTGDLRDGFKKILDVFEIADSLP